MRPLHFYAISGIIYNIDLRIPEPFEKSTAIETKISYR